MPRNEFELAFTSEDGTGLAGSMLIPEHWSGQHAAVIQAGSVLCDRDGNVPRIGTPSTLYRSIARRLEAHGIATFRYDKRQFNRQPPQPLDYTLRHRASDLAAAWQAASSHLAVAPSVVAHSEGGLVTLMAAGQFLPQRLVILGTPAMTILHSMAWRAERQSTGSQTTSVTRARTRIGMVHRLSEQLQAKPEPAVSEREVLLEQMRKAGVLQGWESWEWLAEHARYDVAEQVRRLSVPTLFIHGARDRVVDPRSHNLFRQWLAHRSDVAFRFEMFQEMGHNGEDTTRKAFTLRDDMLAALAQWLQQA